ncbi:hypothetical protein F4775DRAFT_566201 [Biscogniauxia sp. FL1348]|nr:hypothetical protein F4775DRAFT_566201 [Biscogniauxia sp. FL1348]
MAFKSPTTSRLRRPFAYPTDSPSSLHDSASDSDGPPLDEQEQEDLIRSLSHQNATRNAQFRLALLSVPLLSTTPYLLALTRSPSPSSPSPWISALALSSLCSTAWTLWALPPGVTGVRVLDAWVSSTAAANSSNNQESDEWGWGKQKSRRGSSSSSSTIRRRSMTTATMGVGPMAALAQWASWRRKGEGRGGPASTTTTTTTDSSPFWAPGQRRSPLEQYLPFLNAALCAVLVLTGLLSGNQGGGVASSSSSAASAASAHKQQYWGHVGLNNLPAIVYIVVLAAKMVMGSVDPERELAGLKYGYKGA